MRTYTLFLVLLFAATLCDAQWQLGVTGGLNRKIPVKEQDVRSYSRTINDVDVPPALLAGIQMICEKDRPITFGVGFSLKQNIVHNYYEWVNGVMDVRHNSLYVSVHPIIDIAIGNGRYFHLMANPNFNVLVWGRDNGYIHVDPFVDKVLNNETNTLKRFVLGINTQLQFRYPVTKNIKALVAVGYSINNTTSKYVPEERGNISGQAGLVFSLRKKAGGLPDEQKTD